MTDSIVTRVGRLLRRPPRQIAQRVLDAAGDGPAARGRTSIRVC